MRDNYHRRVVTFIIPPPCSEPISLVGFWH